MLTHNRHTTPGSLDALLSPPAPLAATRAQCALVASLLSDETGNASVLEAYLHAIAATGNVHTVPAPPSAEVLEWGAWLLRRNGAHAIENLSDPTCTLYQDTNAAERDELIEEAGAALAVAALLGRVLELQAAEQRRTSPPSATDVLRTIQQHSPRRG